MNLTFFCPGFVKKTSSPSIRTIQIIQYRVTAIHRPPHVKQDTCSNEGGSKTKRASYNYDKV